MSLGQPSPPNPATEIANANTAAQGQATLNTGVAEGNQASSNYNQYDPYGSITYSQTGTGPNGTPIYSSNTSLTPTQQNLLNLLQGTQTTAGTQAGTLLSGANYGSQSPSDAIGNLTSGLVNQNTQEYLAANQPFYTTQSQQLDTSLRNQGLAPGDPAYDNAVRQLDVNQGLAVSGATAAFEPTAFNQATTEYTLPASLSTSLAGFGAPANPTTEAQSGAGLNIQTPNEAADLSAETTPANQQYQAQQAQYNAMINGIMNVGSDAVGLLAL